MNASLPSETESAAAPLRAIFPKWLVATLALVAFVGFTVFLARWLWLPATMLPLERPFPRVMTAVALGIYLGIFFFVAYPQKIVAHGVGRRTIALTGPPALASIIIYAVLELMPTEGSATRYFRLEKDLEHLPYEALDVHVTKGDAQVLTAVADGEARGLVVRFPGDMTAVTAEVRIEAHRTFECELAAAYTDGLISIGGTKCE